MKLSQRSIFGFIEIETSENSCDLIRALERNTDCSGGQSSREERHSRLISESIPPSASYFAFQCKRRNPAEARESRSIPRSETIPRDCELVGKSSAVPFRGTMKIQRKNTTFSALLATRARSLLFPLFNSCLVSGV